MDAERIPMARLKHTAERKARFGLNYDPAHDLTLKLHPARKCPKRWHARKVILGGRYSQVRRRLGGS